MLKYLTCAKPIPPLSPLLGYENISERMFKTMEKVEMVLSDLLDRLGITDPWVQLAIIGIFRTALIFSVPAFILGAWVF